MKEKQAKIFTNILCIFVFIFTLNVTADTLPSLRRWLSIPLRNADSIAVSWAQKNPSATERGAICSHPNSEKKIALTFDDGPSPSYTAKILDILAKYDVKATFFVIGKNAKAYPELIRRQLCEGHEVGNHTESHSGIRKMTDTQIRAELKLTEDGLYEIADYRPHLFRPPEGCMSTAVRSTAESMDYTLVLWNLDTKDWAHTPTADIVKTVLDNAESGDIILFHDFIAPPSPTPEALEEIIPALLDRGYRFVTVSELIGTA